ncbi:MAG: helix-turn-helix domain-containing protein [Muribaculaceae bacterium]|nr:helix-turn-helix domain-containing protein [Muribaculaceae bacterium]
MYTELGKWLKLFRLSEGIRLYDMADKMNVSSAFLSAIETGKKTVPTNFFDKMTELYTLSQEQKNELLAAIVSTREQLASEKNAIKFTINNPRKGVDNLAVSFARNANYLTEEQRKKLLEILAEAKGGN